MIAQAPLQSGLMMGMSHALHTGNTIIDMIVAMILASLVGTLAMNQQKWARWLQEMFDAYMNDEYTAYVVLESHDNVLHSSITSKKMFTKGTNHIFDGIRTYLQNSNWDTKKVYWRFNEKYAPLEFHNRLSVMQPNGCERVPYHNEWITVPFEDSVLRVKYMFEDRSSTSSNRPSGNGGRQQVGSNGEQDTPRISFVETLMIRGRNVELVNRFITSTTACVITKANEATVALRNVRSNHVTRSISSGVVVCNVFALENRKSFDTLHFDEKEHIIHTLNHFMAKEGVFAKPSRPHRLNILLHGPPGTGKTSLIKSIAQHMDRSIVSINLSSIDSSTALQQLMLAGESITDGTNFGTNGLAGLVLVLEELDTYVDLLKERTSQKNMLYVPTGNKEDRVDLKALRDMIDIRTILECLDGTIDTPNRVLIMTTNHIEKLNELDAAFLRPGRVDISLHMGYMSPQSCRFMLCQEFDVKPTDEQIEFFEDYVKKHNVTPAMFESWCIEATSIEKLQELVATRN